MADQLSHYRSAKCFHHVIHRRPMHLLRYLTLQCSVQTETRMHKTKQNMELSPAYQNPLISGAQRSAGQEAAGSVCPFDRSDSEDVMIWSSLQALKRGTRLDGREGVLLSKIQRKFQKNNECSYLGNS